MKFLRELMEKQWEETGLHTWLEDEPDDHPKKRAIARQRKQSGHEFMGAGINAYVSGNQSPHEMDNVKRLSDATDPTARYLKWLHDHPEAANNPYLPRVMNYRQGKDLSRAKIERLIPLTSPKLLSWPLLTSTWEHMFASPAPTHEDINREANEELTDAEALEQFAGMITDAFDLILRGNEGSRHPRVMQEIIDPQLQQALELLRSIRNGGYPDIHTGNVMWRMTGTRPQLVITDPFT